MKRVLTLFLLLLPLCWALSSCSSSSSSTVTQTNRVFVTQDINASSLFSGVITINSMLDLRTAQVAISAGATPGLMAVTPNRNFTLVFSAFENQLSIITNATATNSAHVTLPGFTESVIAAPDSQTAYAAVPTAPELGQSPGAVKVVSLNSGAITGEVDIPGVRYISLSNTGNRMLAFSDNSDSVALITPSNIGTGVGPVTVGGFDRPIWAYFSSDDNTAYVLNSGPERGGVQAGVQTLDLTTTPPTLGTKVVVPAATVATVVGTTMYIAGTPYASGVPSQPCTGQATLASTCGLLTIVDLTSLTVTNPAPVIITDGYHKRISMGYNNQLFIGASNCTEIIPPIPAPPNAEVRGCLSIYNAQNGAVVIPSANGDATGFQPIARRTVMYVIQGGELAIYDTTTDKLQVTPPQINLAGEAIDVKAIDF